uniref:Uncharacterized protein n=1 Tax=Ditylenchus dipsaci TaxID=166011 RepID=A0A915EGT3_9BILA
MELGISSTELWTYGCIGTLFSICVIFPPQEFGSAGFTIPKIFYFLLGDERFNFVEFHLRRTILTVFIHSCLPFFFCVVLEWAVPQRIFSFNPVTLIQYFAALSILTSIGFATFLFLMFSRSWENHYIVRYLKN